MSDDDSPSGFETLDDSADGDPAGEQAASPASSPMGRLFDGNAQGPSTTELKADYGVPQWLAITLRGILRVATGEGVPPLFEITFGGAMGAYKYADSADLGDSGGDSGASGDVEVTAADGG